MSDYLLYSSVSGELLLWCRHPYIHLSIHLSNKFFRNHLVHRSDAKFWESWWSAIYRYMYPDFWGLIFKIFKFQIFMNFLFHFLITFELFQSPYRIFVSVAFFSKKLFGLFTFIIFQILLKLTLKCSHASQWESPTIWNMWKWLCKLQHCY